MLGERTVNAVAAGGICLVTFAVVDHYDRLFFASVPLTVVLLAVITIPADRPQGYVHRVAMATFGFLLFGFCLGYVGNFANVADLGNGADYRPLLVTMVLAVAMNDMLAYCVGKALGQNQAAAEHQSGQDRCRKPRRPASGRSGDCGLVPLSSFAARRPTGCRSWSRWGSASAAWANWETW